MNLGVGRDGVLDGENANSATCSRGIHMSISSVGANSSKSLFNYLNTASSGADSADLIDDGSPADAIQQPPAKGPVGFWSNELEQQGYSGTDLAGLLTKVQDAVNTVRSEIAGRPEPGAIHDAVTKVLKDAGVDTDKIDQDFKAAHLHAHRHGGADGQQAAQDDGLDAILNALGVDPAKFKSALQSAIANAGDDGSIDVSQLFASAAVGSQLDVQA
jgi:hypothetical protein